MTPDSASEKQDRRTPTQEEGPKRPAKSVKSLLKRLETWWGILGLIAAIVGGIYGAISWIRTSAQNAVMDEKFLATLAARVRPTCIFNSRGAIEANFGTEDYVADIQITPNPEVYGFEIGIKCKRHLAYAPLVSGINVDLYPKSVERGKLHDWRIVLAPESTVDSFITEAGMDTNRLYHFKLEILH